MGKVGWWIIGVAFLAMWVIPVPGALVAISAAVGMAIRSEQYLPDSPSGAPDRHAPVSEPQPPDCALA